MNSPLETEAFLHTFPDTGASFAKFHVVHSFTMLAIACSFCFERWAYSASTVKPLVRTLQDSLNVSLASSHWAKLSRTWRLLITTTESKTEQWGRCGWHCGLKGTTLASPCWKEDYPIQVAEINLAMQGFEAAPPILRYCFLCFGNYDHLLITTQV